MEQLQKLLARVPIVVLAALYCGYLAYDYYDFLNSQASDLGMKKDSLVASKQEFEAQKKKLAAGEEFFKGLDMIRDRIKLLTGQLDATKTSLNADIDIANFVKMITLEVKKLGFQIKSIRPEGEVKKEYYIEVPFSIAMRGAYAQLLVFFDRISKFQQVIRISDFSMRPNGNAAARVVELDGTVKLVAYKYLGSAADEIVNKDTMKSKEREQWNKSK